jgi:hypothetical protein
VELPGHGCGFHVNAEDVFYAVWFVPFPKIEKPKSRLSFGGLQIVYAV